MCVCHVIKLNWNLFIYFHSFTELKRTCTNNMLLKLSLCSDANHHNRSNENRKWSYAHCRVTTAQEGCGRAQPACDTVLQSLCPLRYVRPLGGNWRDCLFYFANHQNYFWLCVVYRIWSCSDNLMKYSLFHLRRLDRIGCSDPMIFFHSLYILY